MVAISSVFIAFVDHCGIGGLKLVEKKWGRAKVGLHLARKRSSESGEPF